MQPTEYKNKKKQCNNVIINLKFRNNLNLIFWETTYMIVLLDIIYLEIRQYQVITVALKFEIFDFQILKYFDHE